MFPAIVLRLTPSAAPKTVGWSAGELESNSERATRTRPQGIIIQTD